MIAQNERFKEEEGTIGVAHDRQRLFYYLKQSMMPLENDPHLHGIDLLSVQLAQDAPDDLHLFEEIYVGFAGKNISDPPTITTRV